MPSFHSPATPSLPSSQISQPQRISNSSVLRDPPVAALPLALASRGVGYFLLLDGTTQEEQRQEAMAPLRGRLRAATAGLAPLCAGGDPGRGSRRLREAARSAQLRVLSVGRGTHRIPTPAFSSPPRIPNFGNLGVRFWVWG